MVTQAKQKRKIERWDKLWTLTVTSVRYKKYGPSKTKIYVTCTCWEKKSMGYNTFLKKCDEKRQKGILVTCWKGWHVSRLMRKVDKKVELQEENPLDYSKGAAVKTDGRFKKHSIFEHNCEKNSDTVTEVRKWESLAETMFLIVASLAIIWALGAIIFVVSTIR